MSVEMKTLTIDGVTYEIVDETAREDASKSIPKVCVQKEEGDITDLLGSESCRYIIGNEVTGMPIDDEWWFVDVLSNGSADLVLIATSVTGTPEQYVRICMNEDWYDWRKVVTADGNNHISVAAVDASESVTVSNDETSMSMYVNGISDGKGNLWIDANGDAYFKTVYANDKKLATEEYAMPAKTSGVTITTSTTLTASHAEKMLLVNSSSAVTITVPSGSTIPDGTLVNIVAVGTGAVTLVAGNGATLKTKDSKLKIDGQYAAVTLYKESSTVWHGWGALA